MNEKTLNIILYIQTFSKYVVQGEIYTAYTAVSFVPGNKGTLI